MSPAPGCRPAIASPPRRRIAPGLGLALAVVAAAQARDGNATTLTRGPYLQCATQNSIVIRWRTSDSTDTRVTWVGDGPLPVAAAQAHRATSERACREREEITASGTLADAVLTNEHETKIQGLSPGTRYWYSVGSSGATLAGGPSCTFVTPAPVGSVQPLRAWILGDSGEPGADQIAVRNAFLAYTGARRADLFLMLGDNAYSSGTDAEYQAGLFTPYATSLRQYVLWPTRGNHDDVRSGANNDYYDFFTLPSAGQAGGVPSGTEAYYSYDYANVHFVCLDSEGSDNSPGGAMVTWLRADLAATSQDWIIAYWHHPPYSKGSHDSDTESELIAMRQNVVPVLDTLGADLVLSGHSHSYERSFLLRWNYGLSTTLTAAMKVDPGDGRRDGNGPYHKPFPKRTASAGIVYAVAGSSSKTGGGSLNHPVMVSSQDVTGSLVLDVQGGVLDMRFLNSAGAVTDSFTIMKLGLAAAPAASGRGFAILEVSPRPSRGAVDLSYKLPHAGLVKVAIYDAAGRRIATVAEGEEPAGARRARWDGRGPGRSPIRAGVYFAVVDFGGERRTAPVVLAP